MNRATFVCLILVASCGGKDKPPEPAPLPEPTTGSITLSWMPPTENDDGSPLVDLAGYNIYWGIESMQYDQSLSIDNPGLSAYVLDGLPRFQTFYFVMTALNAEGIESEHSNEVSKTVP